MPENLDPRQPERYPRCILLCVVGTSPAIITETLYALAVKPAADRQPFVPRRVVAITTAEGREKIQNYLLPPKGAKLDPEASLAGRAGEFLRLLADYPNVKGLDECQFDERSIVVIQDERGRPLDDIVTEGDNERAADCIMRVVRDLTEGERAGETAIHGSVAGGRKSMGFYLGYCVSLFGRPQDRVSHVLVSDKFDEDPDFFYPRPVRYPLASGRYADEATVELAKVPVVFFNGLTKERPEYLKTASYTEVVERIAAEVAPPRLTIHLESEETVIDCGGIPLPLRNEALAFYVWLAVRRKMGLPGFIYSEVMGSPLYLELNAIAKALGAGRRADILGDKTSAELPEYFTGRKQEIDDLAKERLVPSAYRIPTVRGRSKRTVFGLDGLSPEAIVFEGAAPRINDLMAAVAHDHDK